MDGGHLGYDFALLSIVIAAAVLLQLFCLHPKVNNKTDE